jgi:plastocyanin
MRPGSAFILLPATLTLAVVPAFAADQAVTATPSDEFTPANVAVNQGEKVTWTNAGGSHNVKFDDGSFEQPANPSSSPWMVSRTFNSPGTFRYYCEQHGGPNGAGMSGTVTVQATGTPPDGSPPSNEFTFGETKKNKRKGTAKLIVNVPGSGELDLAETEKVKGAHARAEAEGQASLPVEPTRKTNKRLNARGTAKVTAGVTYAPDGGDTSTQTKTLKLVKRG